MGLIEGIIQKRLPTYVEGVDARFLDNQTKALHTVIENYITEMGGHYYDGGQPGYNAFLNVMPTIPTDAERAYRLNRSTPTIESQINYEEISFHFQFEVIMAMHAKQNELEKNEIAVTAVDQLSRQLKSRQAAPLREAAASSAEAILQVAFGSVDDERIVEIKRRMNSGIHRLSSSERRGREKGLMQEDTSALLRDLVANPPIIPSIAA